MMLQIFHQKKPLRDAAVFFDGTMLYAVKWKYSDTKNKMTARPMVARLARSTIVCFWSSSCAWRFAYVSMSETESSVYMTRLRLSRLVQPATVMSSVKTVTAMRT